MTVSFGCAVVVVAFAGLVVPVVFASPVPSLTLPRAVPSVVPAHAVFPGQGRHYRNEDRESDDEHEPEVLDAQKERAETGTEDSERGESNQRVLVVLR